MFLSTCVKPEIFIFNWPKPGSVRFRLPVDMDDSQVDFTAIQYTVQQVTVMLLDKGRHPRKSGRNDDSVTLCKYEEFHVLLLAICWVNVYVFQTVTSRRLKTHPRRRPVCMHSRTCITPTAMSSHQTLQTVCDKTVFLDCNMDTETSVLTLLYMSDGTIQDESTVP